LSYAKAIVGVFPDECEVMSINLNLIRFLFAFSWLLKSFDLSYL
jgi:hypothetical protein